MASITKEELRAEIVGKLVISDSDYFCCRGVVVFCVLSVSVVIFSLSVSIFMLNFVVKVIGEGTASDRSVHHIEPAGV